MPPLFRRITALTLSAYFTWGVYGKSTFVVLFLTVVVTLVIVFFGEVIPKLYANKNKVFFVKLSFPLINVFYFLFRPLVLLLVMISKTFKTNKKVLLESSKDEINKAMSLTIDKTTPEEEKNILEGIINFGAIKVKEIMKSRIDVVAFDVGSPFINIANQINTSGYSRIPVFKETIDNIEGVLYVKDLIPHLNNPEFDWTNKIRPAFFVPENKNIDMLFKDFQEKRVHLAVVIDEYGGVSGIVTVEDVIEEIVGDIKDPKLLYDNLKDCDYFIAGAAIQWLRDSLKLIKIASETEKIANSIDEHKEIYVVPAFAGLGAPYWDMYSRGANFGLSRDTGRKHIIKATMRQSIFLKTD